MERTTSRQVGVVAPGPMIGDLLASALGGDPRLELGCVAARASDLPDGSERPLDVVLLVLGEVDADREVETAAARQPGARVIGLEARSPLGPRALDGVHALVAHDDRLHQLLACVTGADDLSGSDQVVGGVASVDVDAEADVLPAITPRELEVLHLLAGGETPQQIALQLGIRPHTARDHIAALRRKLDCSTAVQLVVAAHRLGLTSPDASDR